MAETERSFFYARDIENIVQGDYIPIDGCNVMILAKIVDDVRSIIGTSNCACLMKNHY